MEFQITFIALQFYRKIFAELTPQTAKSFRVYMNIVKRKVIKQNKPKVQPTIITVNAIISP
jgi:hypothetical protein